jgi:hypothetical protein
MRQITNPRHVLFYENRIASPISGGGYRSGFHPETGALLDKWGHPYRVIIDGNEGSKVTSPYSDLPPLSTDVIAWSLGKDGQQSAVLEKGTVRSDDIVSWQ